MSEVLAPSGAVAAVADDAGTPVRLDSHLHLWELGEGRYSWLQPSHGVLYASYSAEEAGRVLAEAGVQQAVLVQADDTAADTQSMLDAASEHAWIVGVVGWLPLENPAACADLLAQWGADPKFCGVRTLVHDDPRPDVLELATVRESLRLLSDAGLAFDVPDAFPRHLGQAAELAGTFPELRVVIDHLGKPPRAGDSASMAEWERQVRRVAAHSNTVAKVSGLFAGGAEFSAEALSRVWDVALSAFGPYRLMFGGDWPVSLLGAPYGQTLNVAAELIDTLAPSEAQAVWAGTATETYGL